MGGSDSGVAVYQCDGYYLLGNLVLFVLFFLSFQFDVARAKRGEPIPPCPHERSLQMMGAIMKRRWQEEYGAMREGGTRSIRRKISKSRFNIARLVRNKDGSYKSWGLTLLPFLPDFSGHLVRRLLPAVRFASLWSICGPAPSSSIDVVFREQNHPALSSRCCHFLRSRRVGGREEQAPQGYAGLHAPLFCGSSSL